MSPGRFKALAQAYGGDLGRWPPGERGEAERLLAASPELEAALSDARRLDAALAGYAVAAPAAHARARIAGELLRRRAPRIRLGGWLPGLGLAGALAAGALAGGGAMALVLVAGPPQDEGDGAAGLYQQTSFGDLAGPDDATADRARR